MTNDSSHIYNQISSFLEGIGIHLMESDKLSSTFLPGIQIMGSTIYVDKPLLLSPGDLLHEAGHIAVTEEIHRSKIGTKEQDDNWPSDGDEFAAILWSYAAATHLKIDPIIVFHSEGYKNESEWLLEQFASGNYIGLPILQWMGFCGDEVVFPKLRMWMRP